MIWFGTTKRLIFCPSSRSITNQIRDSPAYSVGRNCSCALTIICIWPFFYRALIVVIGPLVCNRLVVSKEGYCPRIRFYSIITIVFRELVRFVHMTLIITNRSRSFVMHDHFYSFGLRIVTNSFDIKNLIRSYEIKDIIFEWPKPIFHPSFHPSTKTPSNCVAQQNQCIFFTFSVELQTTVGFTLVKSVTPSCTEGNSSVYAQLLYR